MNKDDLKDELEMEKKANILYESKMLSSKTNYKDKKEKKIKKNKK